ncbi:hypothetical protein IEO21_11210 [Rhodonia placenta]|uniref:Uncharacterized protein n=1 Tax=Rhodonia placenta TaxID=104341 RepID=A0A8H7TWR8_9APHY|nr:hypothetical protein IEO21_11210 [Postia placenta]
MRSTSTTNLGGSFASSARSAPTSLAVERSSTTWTSTYKRWRRRRSLKEESGSCAGLSTMTRRWRESSCSVVVFMS